MSDLHNDIELTVSPNPADERRAQLAALIPDAFSEGRLDLAALKRALGEAAVVEGGERYALTWAGKSDAYRVLQTPSTATLRPERNKSVNFDQAQHVFIEGENLEVLKVLQKAYFGKVKLIYIDPPYNTGSDSFIYPDRFQESKEDYLRRINDLADDGTLMREGFFRKNSMESGHYHSNWLSMMLPRLYIARNLLREDGLIFVSCDDNEVHNLRCLMNEVFGEENFISQIIIQSNKRGQTYKDIAKTHEYLLVYGRSEETPLFELPKLDDALPFEDKKGRFDLWELRNRNPKFGRHNRANLYFPIYVCPEELDSNGYAKVSLERNDRFRVEALPRNSEGKDGCWRWSKPKIQSEDTTSECAVVVAKQRRDGEWNVYEKSRKSTTKAKSLWDETEVISEQGTVELGDLGLGGLFDHPKPRGLISKVLRIATEADDLVFDFFAGSATTADALLRLNFEEIADRRLVLIQLPEPTVAGSAAANAGFETIADFSRERFRRVIHTIEKSADLVTQAPANLGFKSYQLSPSNFKQWRGDGIDTPEQLAEQMQMFAKSEKDGVQVEDMLFELLLKFGQELTTPIETLQGKTGLAKSTVARILLESGRLNDAVNNPQAFIDHASELVNAVKREFLVYGDGSEGSGVKYVKLEGAVYEMRRFEHDDLMEVFASNVRAVELQEKTLFSHIVIDSNSNPERLFAQACEDNADVLFYIKLPHWFQIETPVGPYNPDWAVAYRNDTTLYFVAETKKTGNGDHVQLDLLRPIEDLRIECGKRHFKNFEQVQFRVVSTLEELLN